MACNECNNPYTGCTKCNSCPETMNACDCPYKDVSTDCSVYTGDDLTNSGILQNSVLTTVIQDMDAFVQNKFEEAIQYLTLINIGAGARVFRGITGIGNKEIRTISAGSDIVVTEGVEDIVVSNLPATETQRGVAQIATQAETDIGTDDEKIVTPAKLIASVTTIVSDPVNLPNATETARGIAEIATQAEVVTGTDNEKIITPAKLQQGVESTVQNSTVIENFIEGEVVDTVQNSTDLQTFITNIAETTAETVAGDPTNLPNSTETQRGVIELATQPEVDAGTDTEKAVTPATLAAYVTDEVSNPVNLPNATETERGVAEIATQAEVAAGTDDEKFVTPLKLETRLGSGGGMPLQVTTHTVVTWSKNTVVSIIHGIGQEPITAFVNAVCVNSVAGYSAGEKARISLTGFDDGGSSATGFGIGVSWEGPTTFNLAVNARVTVPDLTNVVSQHQMNVTDWDLEIVFIHL